MESPATTPDETGILARLDAQDWAGATTQAMRAYGSEVLVYLRGVLHDEAAAMEAFSLFSERIWRTFPGFRREASVKTWAYRTAWWASRDYKRSRAARVEEVVDPEVLDLVREVTATTPGRRSEKDDAWHAVLAALDASDRSILLLRIERELSWREVARIMTDEGEPVDEAALRKRYERLKPRLRELMTKHGLRR